VLAPRPRTGTIEKAELEVENVAFEQDPQVRRLRDHQGVMPDRSAKHDLGGRALNRLDGLADRRMIAANSTACASLIADRIAICVPLPRNSRRVLRTGELLDR
jgi:hypothetical protein